MDLRCLVVLSDQRAADPICEVLAELGAEAESCPDAAAAVTKIGAEAFQIVIVDWDQQAEAESVLKAARGRKPNDRPLTLAVVSEDSKIPKALQAGANSILRKPILVNQIKDTLQTARSLLKAQQAAPMAMAARASAAPAAFTVEAPADAHLRAGEFLQSTGPAPGTQIDTESEMEKSIEQTAADNVKALTDLEPTASAVSPEATPGPPAPPAQSGEPRGLQWYLKNRGVSSPFVLSHAEAQVPAAAPEEPELLGYEQSPAPQANKPAGPAKPPEPPAPPTAEQVAQEKKTEAELFAYIDSGASKSSSEEGGRSFRLGKGAIIVAMVLAGFAIIAAPQAPWHPQLKGLWTHGRQAMHAWLNPQPVAPAQAPVSHEDFGRAGDEYKLPVAETIPDATTDPSQIRVTPVVDPTAKKPNPAATVDPNLAPADGTPANGGDPVQAPPDPNAGTPPAANSTQPSAAPATTTPVVTPIAAAPVSAPAATPAAAPKITPAIAAGMPQSDPFANSTANPAPIAPAKNPQPRSPNSNPHIPSSLQSQIASMTPEASGSKLPETALPSIEPVDVPEATERGMLTAQPAIAYPASAKGQQGTVVLQVLIGRDGTVQDAKFLQGSLAFARAAIEGVKPWTFKPYSMNGRPVSVQTKLTLSFRPGQ